MRLVWILAIVRACSQKRAKDVSARIKKKMINNNNDKSTSLVSTTSNNKK